MNSATDVDLERLAFLVGETLGNGPRAELRRLDPFRAATWPAAFWRRFAEDIEPHLGAHIDEAAQRAWAAVLAGMALLPHAPVHPGAALAREGYSEMRCNRLLSARDERQIDEFLTAVRFLAAKRGKADWTQLAQLVLLHPDSPQGDGLRRRFAGAYYRTLAKTKD